VPADERYFRDMYAGSADPWSFTSRWYEQRRYQLTMAALTRPRYRDGYEPACSIGVLSQLLAPRCDRLLCTDLVPAAVAAARSRLADAPQVRFAVQRLPGDWPAGDFDLIVLSEVLYYLTDDDLTATLRLARTRLRPGGDLVAAHWRHPSAEHRLTGDQVHDRLATEPGLHRLGGWCDPDLRLDVYTRGPGDSVAAREGLTGAG
jgi:SAM-dependent methyltransferase